MSNPPLLNAKFFEKLLLSIGFEINPHYALELRNEGLNTNKSGSFMDFSIAPLW